MQKEEYSAEDLYLEPAVEVSTNAALQQQQQDVVIVICGSGGC